MPVDRARREPQARLPRLPPTTIARPRLDAWLDAHAHVPLRMISAPTGAGKTSGIVSYLERRGGSRLYLDLREEASAYHVPDALDPEPVNEALLRRLALLGSTEVVFDGIERCGAVTTAALERLVDEAPEQIRLIYSGTSFDFNIHRLAARGLAAIAPRELLHFDAEETAALARRLSVPFGDSAPEELVDRTDGWAIVISDVLRTAADDRTSLTDALERWIVRRGRSFATYLHEEIQRLPSDVRAHFDTATQAGTLTSVEVQRLLDAGAPIVVDELGYRPYRIVTTIGLIDAQQRAPFGRRASDHLSIRMFGRFIVRSGDREVTWVRRRDQQIFRYAALRHDGTVTKHELTSVFWPDADSHSAAQSLRTACSNIRKALTTALGAESAERIFAADGAVVRIDLSAAYVDTLRFKAHIAAASEAEEEADLAGAFSHYRAAQNIYRTELFGGEPDEPWFLPQREVYRAMAETAGERARWLEEELGNFDTLRENAT